MQNIFSLLILILYLLKKPAFIKLYLLQQAALSYATFLKRWHRGTHAKIYGLPNPSFSLIYPFTWLNELSNNQWPSDCNLWGNLKALTLVVMVFPCSMVLENNLPIKHLMP